MAAQTALTITPTVPKRTMVRVKRVLGHVMAGYSVTKACKRGKVSKSQFYLWMQSFPDVKAAFDRARLSGVSVQSDDLEEALVERGIGWKEKGRKRYDTPAAALWLKANNPRYADKGDQHNHLHIDVGELTREQLMAIAQGAIEGAAKSVGETKSIDAKVIDAVLEPQPKVAKRKTRARKTRTKSKT